MLNCKQMLHKAAACLAGTAMTISMFPAAVHAQGTEDRVQSIMDGMTLDEKITQCFQVEFRQWKQEGEDKVSDLTVMNDEVREMVKKYKFGSLILFANNVKTTEDTYTLTHEFQKAATEDGGIPLFICTDQEGGTVVRLGSGTSLPGNMALGATHSTEDAKAAGEIIGSEMKALGINATLAPVVDVNNNPNNPVIGLRSYGEDPEEVGSLAAAVIEGLGEYGVIGCAKHFPGHGDVAKDSHYDFNVVDKPVEEIKNTELAPYRVAISKGIDMIMTAHLAYPTLDTTKVKSEKVMDENGDPVEITPPATLSKAILTDLLKGEMGFKGVVSTDGMGMAGLTKHFTQNTAAVKAIEAGCDLLCMPVHWNSKADAPQWDSMIQAFKDAIDSGELSMDRLNDAVHRVLTLKAEKGILDYDPNAVSLEEAKTIVGGKVNRAKERELTADSVTVIKNDNNTLPLKLTSEDTVLYMMPYSNERAVASMAWNRGRQAGTVPEGATFINNRWFYAQSTLDDDWKAQIDSADYIVINSEIGSASYMFGGSWLSAFPRAAIAYAKEQGKTVIVQSVALPFDVQDYQDADAIIAVYGNKGNNTDPTSALTGGITDDTDTFGPNIVAGFEVILGTMTAKGTLPVNVYRLNPETKEYDMNDIVYPMGYGLKVEGVKDGNLALLNQAVAYAETCDLTNVNPIVVNHFNEALEEAKKVQGIVHVKQPVINAAWQKLTNAIQMLSFTSDKTLLEAAVKEADAIDLNQYPASPEKEAFENALNHAHEILDSETALDDSIQEALDNLLEAMRVLKDSPVIDTTLLSMLIDVCDGVDLNSYVTAGQDEFNTELANAREVLASPESQERVDNASSTLHSKWLALRLKADESLLAELQNFVDQTADLNPALFTAAAYNNIMAVRADAVSLLATNDVSQEDATSMMNRVLDLNLEPTEPDVDNPVKPDPEQPVTKPEEKPAETKPEEKPAISVDELVDASVSEKEDTKTEEKAAKPASTNKSVKTGVEMLPSAGLGLAALAAMAGAEIRRRARK